MSGGGGGQEVPQYAAPYEYMPKDAFKVLKSRNSFVRCKRKTHIRMMHSWDSK